MGRRAHHERVVGAAVGLLDRGELIRDIAVADQLAQVIRDAVALRRGDDGPVRVFHHDDRLVRRLAVAALGGKLAERRARRVDAHLRGVGGARRIDLLLHRHTRAIDLLAGDVPLLVNEALGKHRDERVRQD